MLFRIIFEGISEKKKQPISNMNSLQNICLYLVRSRDEQVLVMIHCFAVFILTAILVFLKKSS